MFKVATNNEAASIEMLNLKINNASDHSDFWLWDGDVPLVEGTNTSSDYVMFDPLGILHSRSQTVRATSSVSADIGGQNGDDVAVFFDNEVDVEAIGGDFGFGMCRHR